jgi:hypothetical protein
VFGGISAPTLRHVVRRWLPIASVPVVAAVVVVTLVNHAPSRPIAATTPSPSAAQDAGGAAAITTTATPSPTATPPPAATAAPGAPSHAATPRPAPAKAVPPPSLYALTGESAVLIPCGAGAQERFGAAVAMTPDGSELVVGAVNAGNRNGAAYVLRRGASGWTQAARLTVGDAPSGAFGNAVAVSSDGNTVLIGASLAGNGAAYVFNHAADGWGQTAELTANDGRTASDSFGDSVSLSADGLTAAVSRPGYSAPGTAYIFTKSVGWSLTATLSAAQPQSNDGFGDPVALAAGGTRLVLGYAGHSSAGVFDLSGGKWTQAATLTATGSTRLGARVAISADGSTVLVADQGYYSPSGTVFGYRQAGGTWSAQGTLANPGAAGGGYGDALAINATGTRAVVGEYGALYNQGTAYGFASGGGPWSMQRHLSSPRPSSADMYGYAVAMSGDGSVTAVGAASLGATGAVVIFDGTTPASPQTLHC